MAILANSRALTPMSFKGSGWLLNLAKRLCQQTISHYQFDDDPLKYIQVTEWTMFILAILANSRAITPKFLMGSGWLLNLAEISGQQTFSQSLMSIQWKLLKLLSGQMLWTPPAHCMTVFPYVQGRIKSVDL